MTIRSDSFQYRNTRLFKFHADDWCTTKDEVKKASYDNALRVVVNEIEDSLAYMADRPDASFVDSILAVFLPGPGCRSIRYGW